MPIEQWSENVVVVHLTDDPQFSEDLAALEQNRPCASAVLDLAAVHYLNSSNISRLLKLRAALVQADCRMVLCNISTQVWSVFLITGLDKVFEFSDNVTTGLATLQLAQGNEPRG